MAPILRTRIFWIRLCLRIVVLPARGATKKSETFVEHSRGLGFRGEATQRQRQNGAYLEDRMSVWGVKPECTKDVVSIMMALQLYSGL